MKVNKTGRKYGRLLVLGIDHITEGVVYWRVRCDCGTNKTIRDANIHVTKSCGCFKSKGNRKHGFWGTNIYDIWQDMKQRCLNPKANSYKYYGGRGIKICKRWYDIRNFFKDMGERPKGLSLERINSNGNYEPDNCKWATWTEQANNRSNNISLTYQGTTMNLSQWSRKLGISRACLWDRIKRNLPADAIFNRRKFKSCEGRDINFRVDKVLR